MSYYIRFEVAWDGEGPDPFTRLAQKKMASVVEEFLRTEGRLDWRDEFRVAFSGRSAEIKSVEEEWAGRLLTHVSLAFPETGLWARGVGEEIKDVWALLARNGEILWSASLEGQSRHGSAEGGTVSVWPSALDLSRVVAEAGSRRFLREILDGQPAAAEIAALTLKPREGKKPRALVYVGPLGREGYQRIEDLLDDRYILQVFRDPQRILTLPVATAEHPQGS